ncbi:hypothetical protein INR49_007724 [Caranx melampygus]|nr:hypothetical protein INR49_007724 [Caranx melampygus]
MKRLDSDEEEPEQLGAYLKELRQRANRSIQQLSGALEHLHPDGEEVEVRGSDGSLFSTMAEEDTAAWSQKTQSEAVNQLKSLLLKQGREIPPPLSPSKTESPSKEQLKVIYQAQVESLEAQVISLRKDLSVSQKECEDVKVRLRHKEKQAVDALRTDGAPQRDELLVALRAVRASQQEAQQREWSACLQVKQAVEMAEEANLHKARVEVQCGQLSRELIRQREQLEREAQALPERLTEAREKGRAEACKQKDELTNTVSSLSQRVAELEGQLDRAHRDKSSLTNQLEDTLHKLTTQEQDNTKVSVELRYQLSQALLKKDEAERELRELNTKTSRQMEKAAQEVERLSSELVGCRQHLEAVQKDGSQWQAEALSLAEQLANAQRQLHLTRHLI